MQKEILATRRWLEKIVIGLHLCPFARPPYVAGQVRFVVFAEADVIQLARLLLREAFHLSRRPAEEVETTLIILARALPGFEDYLDFVEEAEWMIRENGLEGIVQVASFHPDYQFEGTEPEAPENYTNRSPYPMLHLLREESIERALANYEQPGRIPERNIEKMRELGVEGVHRLLEDEEGTG